LGASGGTQTSENRHGPTIGVLGLADDTVEPLPEPGTLALLGLGLLVIGLVRRRPR
jgi:hypothetical protein